MKFTICEILELVLFLYLFDVRYFTQVLMSVVFTGSCFYSRIKNEEEQQKW